MHAVYDVLRSPVGAIGTWLVLTVTQAVTARTGRAATNAQQGVAIPRGGDETAEMHQQG
nr:hypothetical protein GCM10020063_008760 [Dactylosporangium thailandense]